MDSNTPRSADGVLWVCGCGDETCDLFREDADGVFECRFCGSDWGGSGLHDTGFPGPWHKEWCIYRGHFDWHCTDLCDHAADIYQCEQSDGGESG